MALQYEYNVVICFHFSIFESLETTRNPNYDLRKLL